jgi:hypothetical protein
MSGNYSDKLEIEGIKAGQRREHDYWSKQFGNAVNSVPMPTARDFSDPKTKQHAKRMALIKIGLMGAHGVASGLEARANAKIRKQNAGEMVTKAQEIDARNDAKRREEVNYKHQQRQEENDRQWERRVAHGQEMYNRKREDKQEDTRAKQDFTERMYGRKREDRLHDVASDRSWKEGQTAQKRGWQLSDMNTKHAWQGERDSQQRNYKLQDMRTKRTWDVHDKAEKRSQQLSDMMRKHGWHMQDVSRKSAETRARDARKVGMKQDNSLLKATKGLTFEERQAMQKDPNRFKDYLKDERRGGIKPARNLFGSAINLVKKGWNAAQGKSNEGTPTGKKVFDRDAYNHAQANRNALVQSKSFQDFLRSQ